MADRTSTKKPAARRETHNLSRLASEVSSTIGRHEKLSADIMALVEARFSNLEAMGKTLESLKVGLSKSGGVNADSDRLLRKLHDDITANLRLTASMRVPLQRGPSLKNYKLMAEG